MKAQNRKKRFRRKLVLSKKKCTKREKTPGVKLAKTILLTSIFLKTIITQAVPKALQNLENVTRYVWLVSMFPRESVSLR
jgi:hypothetical protein